MAWTRPTLEPWVYSFNAQGELTGDGGRSLVPLDAEQAMATARASTGLDDFGDDAFREGLEVFVRALEEEAELTLLGRVMARAEIARVLESRLRIERVFAEYPEIDDEVIEAPVFVTGLARTGTSLLHELLWRDPANRCPLTWEMIDPAFAAETGDREPDAVRLDAIVREVDLMNQMLPAIKTMHEHDARLPSECIFLFAHHFATDTWSGQYRVPSYSIWKSTSDPRPSSATHRRLLKLLQWRRPRRRWVLKAPSHLGSLGPLFETYPDARVVVTHRDPLKSLGSLANLMASLQSMRSHGVDYDAVVQAMAFGHGMLPQRVMEQRDKGTVPDERITDLRYCDLVDDPSASVGRICDFLGTPISPALRQAIDDWVASRPKDRHGAHEYRFEDTGLDLAAERARHAAYMARYDIPEEVG